MPLLEKGVMKMTKYLLLLSCALSLASGAVAQTKTSGSIDCQKADPMHVIQIPDRPGFSYAISQSKCTWTKSMTLAGIEGKEFVNTGFSETTGASTRTTGIGVTNYGADKVYSRSTGTFDQKTLTYSGKWTFIDGTGKLRGIKGSGTYACKAKSAEPGAGYTCESEGEYTLPATKK
jgi:hypothetical protein